MNIFRLFADLLHLASILILILKIRNTKNCLGIFLYSKILYNSFEKLIFEEFFFSLSYAFHNFFTFAL